MNARDGDLGGSSFLLESMAGHRFEVAVMIALAYGMRRGEVLGLHWPALDWKAGTIGVTHSVKRIKNRDQSSDRKTRLVVTELKTPRSRRFSRLLRRLSPCSAVTMPVSLKPGWRSVRSGRITGHGLRQSGASLMFAQGTPLHVVSEILGHASIAITKDVYGHLDEGDKRKAAESLSRALFGAQLPAGGSQPGSKPGEILPRRVIGKGL